VAKLSLPEESHKSQTQTQDGKMIVQANKRSKMENEFVDSLNIGDETAEKNVNHFNMNTLSTDS